MPVVIAPDFVSLPLCPRKPTGALRTRASLAEFAGGPVIVVPPVAATVAEWLVDVEGDTYNAVL